MGQDCSACDEPQDLALHINRGAYHYQFIQQNIKQSKCIQSENRNRFIQKVVKQGFYSLWQGKALFFSQKLGYYEGFVNKQKQAHGKGTMISLNWDEYKGQFSKNKYHGEGTIKNKQNSIKFQGHWKEGFPSQGTLYFGKQNPTKTILKNIKKLPISNIFRAQVWLPNKLHYNGQLKLKQNSLAFHGQGFMQFPDGSKYDGNWFEGAMEGYGVYTWENGNYYEGNYSFGKRNGKGKMYFKKQNSTFQGIWYRGTPKLKSIIHQSIDLSSQQSDQFLINKDKQQLM